MYTVKFVRALNSERSIGVKLESDKFAVVDVQPKGNKTDSYHDTVEEAKKRANKLQRKAQV